MMLLLQNGANPEVVNDGGFVGFANYPIHDAARENKLEALQVLVEYGKADINSRAKDVKMGSNSTPLIVAAGWNFIEGVKFLVRSCADLSLKNEKGHTALEAAKWRFNQTGEDFKPTTQIIELLQDTNYTIRAQAHCKSKK